MSENQKYLPLRSLKQQIRDLYIGQNLVSQLNVELWRKSEYVSGWVKQLSPIKVSKIETVTSRSIGCLQKRIQPALRIENEILKKATPYSQKDK